MIDLYLANIDRLIFHSVVRKAFESVAFIVTIAEENSAPIQG